MDWFCANVHRIAAAIEQATRDRQALEASAKAHGITKDCAEVLKAQLAEAIAERDAARAQLAAMTAERDQLRGAIKRAGYAVMQTSGDWLICDVSEYAKKEEERTAQVISENIELSGKLAAAEQREKGLLSLLRRAYECCRLIPPPASDNYTSGLQADIAAVMRAAALAGDPAETGKGE